MSNKRTQMFFSVLIVAPWWAASSALAADALATVKRMGLLMQGNPDSDAIVPISTAGALGPRSRARCWCGLPR